jgi:DNA replication protein DnaC
MGTGKSHIAATAAYERLQRGGRLRWTTVPTLLNRALTDESRDEAGRLLTEGRLPIVLDDLTKAGGSRWAASQIFAAIDGRVAEGTAFLLTANLRPRELAQAFGAEFGDAIKSRVAEACAVVELVGRDRRVPR